MPTAPLIFGPSASAVQQRSVWRPRQRDERRKLARLREGGAAAAAPSSHWTGAGALPHCIHHLTLDEMRAPAAFNPSTSQYSSPKQQGFDRTRRPTEESGVSVIMSDDFHHTYMQPPQTANEVHRQVDAAERRFVAGTAFFNYEEFGSLRPGLPTVQIFSREYIGLAIHLLLVGFSYYFFTFGFGRLLSQYLKANSNSQVQAANYMLIWPQALSIFIGLVSDSYPILGYRRKSYMIVGWVISLLAYAGLVVLDTLGDSSTLLNKALTDDGVKPDEQYGVPFLLVSLLGAFGIQVGWIAAMAAGVEYAQREHLHYRGQLQCIMLAFYFVGGLIGHIVIAIVISRDVVDQSVVSSISIGTSALILAAVAFAAIPVCVLFYAEDKYVKINRPTPSMRNQIGEFWKFCHQNVVYRILFFIIGHLFFIGLFDQSTRDAVREWSAVASTDSVVGDVAKMGVALLAVILWSSFLTNVSWRKIATFASALYIVVNGVLHYLTTYEVVRDKYFYSIMMAVAELPRVWLLVFAVILATEISDVGREALTLALGISYRSLAGLVDYTIAVTVPAVIGMKVSDEEIALDADSTRSTVTTSTSVMLALNCVAFAFILALPSQKLDAQQLRAFGGYNRFASSGLLLVFVVLLVFNLVANVIAVL